MTHESTIARSSLYGPRGPHKPSYAARRWLSTTDGSKRKSTLFGTYMLSAFLLSSCVGIDETEYYRILPGDCLTIMVEATRHDLTVTSDGYILVPPSASLRAAGRTPEGLANLISEQLGNLIVIVTVQPPRPSLRTSPCGEYEDSLIT